jgi:hypothetical protein
MKIRFGALAFVVVLAACSGQDQSRTGNSQAGGMASTADAGVSPAIAGYSNDSKRSLGSAPDRGELFTYQKSAAVLRHGAYTLRPIALSEEHAIRGVATGMMTIPAPDGSEIKIRYDRHEESPDGNWSWIGRVVGGDQAREAVFTFGEHGVFGSIPQLTGPSLQLTTERGIAYMVQADPTKLFRASRKGGDTKTRVAAGYDASSMREADSLIAGAMHKATEQASVSPKAFTASNTIDLVAGYSNGLATRLGGASVAVTKLNNLVAIGNVALQNSKVNARIRLVHALQVNYADNTLNDTALDQLTGHDGAAPVTIPAALAPLRAARDQYGADLATLVRDFKSENDGCGIAWLNGANGVAITAAKDAPFGYSVVSEGQFVDANGNTNYCEDISLVHELAHNMGSAHDIANAGEDTGRYPYSYGYKTTAAQGNFFTVMAYGDNNQTLYRVFSNPAITTCGGLACGVANAADNARSLSQTIPIVATFRSTIVPVGIPARTDVNGNGRSDMLWRNADGRLSYWLMTGSAINFSSPSVAQNPAYKMVATGDFTGDGRTDIVWQSPANVVLWTAGTQTNPLFTASTIAATPAGWSIVGSADMNGDGKADLLWRNTASGKFSYWLMNGSAIVSQTPSVVIPTAYKLVAIGDFNGDGIGDLVWDNNVAVWSWVNNNNGTFTQKQITAHPAGWGIVGAGDISGDGKSDLLWRNTSTGNFSYWVMNGAVATTKSASLPVTTAYKLSAIGDFNGDGRADLVWDNNVSVWLWSAPTTGTAFPQSRVANHPAGWTLQDPPGL